MKDIVRRNIQFPAFLPPPGDEGFDKFWVAVVSVHIARRDLLFLGFSGCFPFFQKCMCPYLAENAGIETPGFHFLQSIDVRLPLGEQVGCQVLDAFLRIRMIDLHR